MHELAIAQQILEIVSASIPADVPEAPVESIQIRVGKLTAIVPASLHFCFGIVAQDTRLAGARLDIEEVPLVGRCQACGAENEIDGPPFACPACDGDLDFVSGRELTVDSIELADPEPV